MLRFKSLYLLLILLSYPMQSFAAKTSVARSVGGVFDNITSNIKTTGGLFRVICYLSGLVITMMGLFKLKECMDNPGKVGLKEPIAKLFVGAFFVALPAVIAIIIDSTVGSNGAIQIDMTRALK